MIDFPVGATIGQEFYTSDKKYTWDGVKWKLSSIAVDWVRPSDWLTMPSMLATEQKFIGLYAVFPHNTGIENSTNFVALQFSSTGTYTVDWGDGTIESFASAVQAQHLYDYNTISSTTNCTRGYRQVLITVTPQATFNLTAIALNKYHSLLTTIAGNNSWLDILCSLPNVSSFAFGNNSGSGILARLLENINILSLGAMTSYETLFGSVCTALQKVTMPINIPTVVNTRYMFYGCYALISVNLFYTGNSLDCSAMFYNCRSLKTVPNFDVGRSSLFTGMFYSCYSLLSIPLLNLSANTAIAINCTSMFIGCVSLTTIPLLNFSNCTNFFGMFIGCTVLKTIPAIDTSKGTAFDSMFNNCTDLMYIPPLNTTLGTSFARFAQMDTPSGLASLQTCTPFDFTNVSPGGTLQLFNGNYSTSDLVITNCKYNLVLSNMRLSQNTLTQIMNNLPPLPAKIASIAGTGVASNSIITLVGHGFANTAPIVFKSNGSTTGINIGTTYYTNNTTIDTFQVSAASGGALLALTNNSSNAIVSLSSSISLGGNPGTGGIYSYTNCNTTLGSKTVVVTVNATGCSCVSPNKITTDSAHNLLTNQRITFRSINGSPGITVNTIYWVVNISGAQIFQLSSTDPTIETTIVTVLTISGHSYIQVPLDSQVTGPGSPLTTPIPVTFTASKIILTNHQLLANDIVSFPTVTNNLVTYTPYYITGTVNSGDFQIAANTGGTPLTFTDGTGTMLYDSTLVSISGSASPFTFTMSRPMTATTTANTMAFRTLKTSIALMKNWTVTG